ncbi:hypothetical protein [Paracraurococcus ruber]|uniref:hypothetical protein n=1 Tax=Paracraurococcus ruber TaxID=77675 RepID=UPI001057BFC6|nr:hypothetical protein [Paracraurococcus ruber]
MPRLRRGHPSAVQALEPAETHPHDGMRGWRADLRQDWDPQPRLGERMAAAGIPPPAASLDMLM